MWDIWICCLSITGGKPNISDQNYLVSFFCWQMWLECFKGVLIKQCVKMLGDPSHSWAALQLFTLPWILLPRHGYHPDSILMKWLTLTNGRFQRGMGNMDTAWEYLNFSVVESFVYEPHWSFFFFFTNSGESRFVALGLYECRFNLNLWIILKSNGSCSSSSCFQRFGMDLIIFNSFAFRSRHSIWPPSVNSKHISKL